MSLPLILNATDLDNALQNSTDAVSLHRETGIRLVDLRSAEAYATGHIQGAIHADASLLNRVESPVGGLMPEPEAVNELMRSIGAETGDHLIAYDGGLETAAGRLIWVLDAYGYGASSWLSGGWRAWTAAGLSFSTRPDVVSPGSLRLDYIGENVISVDALMADLDNSDLSILDVRSENEFKGSDVRSAFGGHVPGARHLEWTSMLDEQGRLLDDKLLGGQLAELGLAGDDTVIVYCQTHQRSAVTYVALKHLGFNDVRAIDGAWSNWGNREDTPKAI